MDSLMYQIATQVGFSKKAAETQHIDIFVVQDDTEEKIGWNKGYEGVFLTPPKDRQNRVLFVTTREYEAGTVIKVETRVFLRGRGFDEDRSKRALLVVGGENIREYNIPKVGYSGYPLVKGKFRIKSECSMKTDRLSRVDGVYDQIED